MPLHNDRLVGETHSSELSVSSSSLARETVSSIMLGPGWCPKAAKPLTRKANCCKLHDISLLAADCDSFVRYSPPGDRSMSANAWDKMESAWAQRILSSLVSVYGLGSRVTAVATRECIRHGTFKKCRRYRREDNSFLYLDSSS